MRDYNLNNHLSQIIPEATITKADEAIQQASYKLTAADKETISGTIAVQNEQSKILGASTGVTGALLFMESLIGAKGTVLDAFAEQSMLEVDNQITEIDQSLINLAEEASTRLGESIRKVSSNCFTALFHETVSTVSSVFQARETP